MSELTTEERKRMPKKEFAGPDKSYPVNDHEHAVLAKGRAKQQLDAGKLSRSSYNSIVAKANRKLEED